MINIPSELPRRGLHQSVDVLSVVRLPTVVLGFFIVLLGVPPFKKLAALQPLLEKTVTFIFMRLSLKFGEALIHQLSLFKRRLGNATG